MKYAIKILSISLMTLTSNSLIAQVDTGSIFKIKTFTKYIDSLADNYANKLIVNSIAEGTLTIETATAGSSKTMDTIKTTKHGGFSRYTAENLKGDTVYRILYHDNIDKNFYESYYYKDNKLVYSKIDYQENGVGKTFYYREEYYEENKILFINESTGSIETMYRQRVTFDLRAKGQDYFKKFVAKQNNF